MSKIDIVVAWVDGSDPAWQEERSKVISGSEFKLNQYRDWGLLKYWFRSIEKYASWVGTIHFVTWGHLPDFLDVNHPKINIVNHSDYIPDEYLPTYSSHPIELNFHRINNLAEKFIYFNDDMYLVNETTESDFFSDGKPKDVAVLNPIVASRFDSIAGIMMNDIGIINEHHDLRRSVKKNPLKWFNFKYKHLNLLNLLFLPWKNAVGLYQQHLPSSMLKSTYETLWDKEYEILDSVSRNKVRNNKMDVNQWLMKEWQVMEGNFEPRSISFGRYMQVMKLSDVKSVQKAITNSKAKTICINDHVTENIDEVMQSLVDTFESKFPEKSSFEK